jgi:hypothetical protein
MKEISCVEVDIQDRELGVSHKGIVACFVSLEDAMMYAWQKWEEYSKKGYLEEYDNKKESLKRYEAYKSGEWTDKHLVIEVKDTALYSPREKVADN